MQASTVAERTPSAAAAAPADEGLQEIYIGFAKGDIAPRAGRKGRVIVDNPTKYPGKDDVGPLPGATGTLGGYRVAARTDRCTLLPICPSVSQRQTQHPAHPRCS